MTKSYIKAFFVGEDQKVFITWCFFGADFDGKGKLIGMTQINEPRMKTQRQVAYWRIKVKKPV